MFGELPNQNWLAKMQMDRLSHKGNSFIWMILGL